MTIAACYITLEGVVLGADSTVTVRSPDGIRHFNYAQKVFQVGERGGSLGLVLWGLSSLKSLSFRTMLANLSDDLIVRPPATVRESMERWAGAFWSEYTTQFATEITRAQTLAGQATRTPDEEKELLALRQALGGGHCMGGHVKADRTPKAFCFEYNPLLAAAPHLDEIPSGTTKWWGCPNLISRLIFGIDDLVTRDVLNCGHWSGTPNDLRDLINRHALRIPCEFPLREAVDWVYSSIFVTIKALKFSSLAPVCGGPIEVAVITTDREFRWACHKGLHDAILFPRTGKDVT